MLPLRSFILDCDTGRDDALAILVAIQSKLPLAGVIASYGNVKLAQVIDNTARVLALAGCEEIALLVGAQTALQLHSGIEKVVLPRQSISGNGLCNLELPKAQRTLPFTSSPAALGDEVMRLVEKHGPLDYVILGPATNFAQLCAVFGDDLHKYIMRVTMMGGKFDPLWSDNPQPDFNFVCDPFAVRKIMESGIEIHFVPINVTWPIELTIPEIEALEAVSPVACFAKALMLAHCRSFASDAVFRFHDPCALLAHIMNKNFIEQRLNVACDEDNTAYGQLILASNGFPAKIYCPDDTTRNELLETILLALELRQ